MTMLMPLLSVEGRAGLEKSAKTPQKALKRVKETV